MGIEELSGRGEFYRNASGDISHTYSSYGRGGDLLLGTYNILDLMPKGRNETGPNHNMTDWVRHHDRYGDDGFVRCDGALSVLLEVLMRPGEAFTRWRRTRSQLHARLSRPHAQLGEDLQ